MAIIIPANRASPSVHSPATLNGGFGNDTFTVEGWNAGIDLTLNGGFGNDVAYVVSVNGRLEDRTFGCERVVVTEVTRVRARR